MNTTPITIERIIRDAIIWYQEAYPDAPNDDVERELKARAEFANEWLAKRGYTQERPLPTTSQAEGRKNGGGMSFVGDARRKIVECQIETMRIQPKLKDKRKGNENGRTEWQD